ncbi:MAG: response regulator [Brumimicrobium sp.]|nr:response regulator [Brumimicrobium sp.]
MSKPVLLIVDDEPDIRALCSSIVRRSFEFDVLESASLNEAKNVLLNRKPDYVLLDLQLKDGIGFDLLPFLFESNPNVKVLVVTAYNQCHEKKRAEDLGAHGLMGKPFKSDDLVERISEMAR